MGEGMSRLGICPTCGNFEQELRVVEERVFEVIESRPVVRYGKNVVDSIPVHYPTTHPTKRGPVHKIRTFYCTTADHLITTEDSFDG